MGTNVTNEGGISRRSFLGGVAGVGALAAIGLAGCSPKAAGTTGAESASSSASTSAAVSYTHLDVYKRQIQHRISR